MARIEDIRTALAEAVHPFRDKRVNVCSLEANLEGEVLHLSGEVLDQETLAAVVADLHQRLSDLEVDTSGVQLLRSDPPAWVTQDTNLTGLYGEPSFHAELVTQNVFGARLEVLKDRGRWGYVKQEDGYQGWAYLPYTAPALFPQPTHRVCAPVIHVCSEPDPASPLITALVAGTDVAASEIRGGWAYLQLFRDKRGWLPCTALRALEDLPQTPAERRHQIVADAARLTGTPYLWGGCSAFGIDCSGLAQLVYRLVGVALPRDADMQYHAGQPVEPPFLPGDLLFFSEEHSLDAITHVGVSLGGWQVIHSSRKRNGVYEDNVQEPGYLDELFVGGARYL